MNNDEHTYHHYIIIPRSQRHSLVHIRQWIEDHGLFLANLTTNIDGELVIRLVHWQPSFERRSQQG
jgi:hypothetical protein